MSCGRRRRSPWIVTLVRYAVAGPRPRAVGGDLRHLAGNAWRVITEGRPGTVHEVLLDTMAALLLPHLFLTPPERCRSPRGTWPCAARCQAPEAL